MDINKGTLDGEGEFSITPIEGTRIRATFPRSTRMALHGHIKI
jgi:hypothetical protein